MREREINKYLLKERVIIIERERERDMIFQTDNWVRFHKVCGHNTKTLELHGNSENKQAMFFNGPGREL